jgi:simple sugar transport system permease protein
MSEEQQLVQEEEEKTSSVPMAVYENMIAKFSDPNFQKTAMWATGSIILALLVAAIVMVMTGYNVGLAFLTLLWGAVTQFDRVLFFATPLIFTGLSVALAFKCGLFNIGPEGQLYMGAMAAAIVGYAISLPIVVHQITALLVGALVGGLYGLFPGLLKAYRGTHEVVTTMMMSYSALLFTAWLVTYPLKDPTQSLDRTPPIFDTAYLPKLFGPFLNLSLIVAILAVIGVDLLINRTVLGYEMRAVGLNPDAAEAAGINSKRNIALALGIAGGLAGLGGAGEILGYHHLFLDNWSTGLGWDGITVAVLGNNNPWGVLAGAIFFGALRAGGNQMQRIAGVPIEMVSLIQGLIVLFVAAPKAIDWLSKRGSDYALWLKNDRFPAFTHLSTTVMAGVSAVFCLTVLGLYSGAVEAGTPGSGGVVGLLLFFTSIISMYGLVELLTRKQRGPLIVIFASIEWFFIAAIGFVATSTMVLIQGAILGGILLVLSILLMRILPEGPIDIGGEA